MTHRSPIALDFEQRQEAERLLIQAADEDVLRDLIYELVSPGSMRLYRGHAGQLREALHVISA